MNAHITPTIIANAFALPTYASAHQDAIAAHMAESAKRDRHFCAMPRAMPQPKDDDDGPHMSPSQRLVLEALQAGGPGDVEEITARILGMRVHTARQMLSRLSDMHLVRCVGERVVDSKHRWKIWEANV